MQKIVANSEQLSKWPEFRAVSKLTSIDVISVRLWLDRKIDFKYPANVLAGFEDQAGSTFFDLNTLQVHTQSFKDMFLKACHDCLLLLGSIT